MWRNTPDVSPIREKSSYLLDTEPFTSDYTKSFLISYFSAIVLQAGHLASSDTNTSLTQTQKRGTNTGH